jgi:hypothetical protein
VPVRLRLEPRIRQEGLEAQHALEQPGAITDGDEDAMVELGSEMPLPRLIGLVENLARPSRNVTGLQSHPDLDGKRLEILKQTLPGLSRMGYLYNPSTPGTPD